MAIEDNENIPEEVRKALKEANKEALESALDWGLAVAMRAQQKLRYRHISMTMQQSGDVVAGIVTLDGKDKVVYAHVDRVTGEYIKS
jgi:hypothetical protein